MAVTPMTATAHPNDTTDPTQNSALPCGAHPADLLEQIADQAAAAGPASVDGAASAAPGPSGEVLAHQRVCPHCRAMIAELRELWAPVAQVSTATITAPPSLTRGIMDRVTALAQHNWHAVVEDNPGATRIAAWVVAIVARRAAASVDGVNTVSGRVHPADPAVADVQAAYGTTSRPSTHQALADGIGIAGRKVVVRVQITAAAGSPMLTVLAEQVRRRVILHVRALTGLDVVEVDVEVTDLELAAES
jgi:uncharacterized alkaline shock family protein YloU